MTVVNYDPKTKGRFTKLAHAILVCTTLIRLCGLFYIILGVLMITKNGVIHRAAFPLLNQFVIGGMPLGNLSAGLIYALFSLFPLHTIFGFLGFFGVIRRNKVIIIIHTCFLLFCVVVDTLCIVLLSMLLYAINSWIKARFAEYYRDYTNSNLNSEVNSSIVALFDAMDCDVTSQGVRCWDKYYQVMDSNIRVFISVLSLSIIMEIINIVLSGIVYRRVDRPGRSPGMFGRCRLFVWVSWNTCRMKFVFVVIQAGDMICSAVLLIGGVVITQSRFVTDSLVLPVFENLRFNNYYLPDIVIGLTFTMILIGCLNLFSCGLGFNMLCYKSDTKSKVHVTYQVVMAVMILITLVFWITLLTAVGDGMSDQLSAEFLVYGDSDPTGLHYTQSWNAIFLTYQCCGVRDNNSFNGTLFAASHASNVVPYQCKSGETLANSKTYPYSTATPIQSSYATVCEIPLIAEVKTYAVLFGVVCGFLLIMKVCNIALIYKNALGLEPAVENQSSIWKTVKDYMKTDCKWLFGSIAFTGIGLMLALGIMIAGLLLRFNDILGDKDIHRLFNHIYISEWDVTYLVTTMSDVMISLGSASFIFFCVGVISVAARVTAMYYVTTVLLLLSVLLKFVCIMVWIPLRISFDSKIDDAMHSALRTNYQTDRPHTELYIEEMNLGFNTLFYRGKCCLNENSFFQQIYYNGRLIEAGAPWTCRHCDSDPTIRWPLEATVIAKCSSSSVFSTSCTTVVLDNTIHVYDTTAVVLSVFMMILEVLLVVVLDRVYKSRVSPGQSRGLISNTCFNNRFINNDKMPNFTLLTVVYVSGSMTLSAIQLSAWIAILIYVIRGDTQLDKLSVGLLQLGEMTKGASITILVVIPVSIVINVFKIRWCLIKWNTGLRWSLLPEAGLLIIDVVIFCLFARQLESIRLSNQNIHPVMYQLNVAYLCVSMSMQVILILIKDRLHKHVDTSLAKPNSSGMFSTLWQGVLTHRYFTVSGKTNKQLVGFVFLSIFLMVWELSTWVAVWLQGVTPGYMKGDFLDDLYDLRSSGRYTVFYSYGYLLWGLVITTLSGELIYVIIHVITMVVAIKQHKVLLYVASGMLLMVFLADIIMTGLTGVLLDTAYNCWNLTKSTAVSQKLCNGPVARLYDLSGVFIGLTVWHAVLVVLLIWLCMYLAGKATNKSHIIPLEDNMWLNHRTAETVTGSSSDSPPRLRHSISPSGSILVTEIS
ncbi:uncharacterized protein LOC110461827 [Mizuhopecten yessoensis]|uniref:uncharacterized protein LOC110461827 n=1 Tax=Mizuhopecten yessoensis TaxID=6573 RepID=UPI000B458C66|nr:uncharacterized protein LOC110461827 [Mizuhopecten yessoensis]